MKKQSKVLNKKPSKQIKLSLRPSSIYLQKRPELDKKSKKKMFKFNKRGENEHHPNRWKKQKKLFSKTKKYLSQRLSKNKVNFLKKKVVNQDPTKASRQLFRAAINKDLKFINKFIGKYKKKQIRLNLDIRDSNHFKITHFAVYYELEQLFNFLVELNVDFNQPTKQGYTCLMLAVIRRNTKFAKTLIPLCSNINQQDIIGNTALHYAVVSERLDIVELFLQNFADVGVVNIKNQTPIDLANHHIIFDLQKIILEYKNTNKRKNGEEKNLYKN